jgi:glyoxylase-like metal-dependent hydrolase (beta-lactamase superfamily II)
LREIAEGIYQLKVPMRYNPLGYTFSYLLKEAATLIDTGVGTHDAFDALSSQLSDAGLRIQDIRRIIVTHLHGDHVGLVDRVRSFSGARVIAHRMAIEIQGEEIDGGRTRFDDFRREVKMLGGGSYIKLLRRFSNAFRRPLHRPKIDDLVEDRDILDLEGHRLGVLWTPGHAREHICLLDGRRGLLYSGDHILPKITPHISLHDPNAGDPLNDYLSSLERIEELPISKVLPAHEHIYEDLNKRIEELKIHHERRCDEIKGALGGGAKTVFTVSSKVSWDSRPWPYMDFWTKRMAAAETLAHLVYLRNRGEVSEESRDGVLYYSLNMPISRP